MKRIHRAWYTTYRASPREVNDRPFAQSKGIPGPGPHFDLADDSMQHLEVQNLGIESRPVAACHRMNKQWCDLLPRDQDPPIHVRRALKNAEIADMPKKGITGHDEWVVTEALATALVALEQLPPQHQPRPHMEDIRKLLTAGCQFGTVDLHLAQAKCRLFPAIDRMTIYREYGLEDGQA